MKVAIFSPENASRLTKIWHSRFGAVLDYNKMDACFVSATALNELFDSINDSDALVSRWADNLWNHYVADVVMARINREYIPTWPDYNAFSIYDDKIKSFVLLDEMNVPTPKSIVVMKPHSSTDIDDLGFPLVLKKRHGSGSGGVELIKNPRELRGAMKKVFSKGYRGKPSRRTKKGVRDSLHSMKRRVFEESAHPCEGKEWGIILLQEFVGGNSGDIKVVILNDKALVIERHNRPGDFRASGSGMINYRPKRDVAECLRIAFEISRKQGFISMGYDFVFDQDDRPLVIDTNYTFSDEAFSKCPGYYDSDGEFHNGVRWPQTEILEAVLSQPMEDPPDVQMGRVG